MFKTAVAILLLVCVSFAIMGLIALLVKIWEADPTRIKEYRRLKDLAYRANDGQADAEHACEQEALIKISSRWNTKWGHVKDYSVYRSALYACFGFY